MPGKPARPADGTFVDKEIRMSTIATALTWWRRRRQPNYNTRYPVAGRTGEFTAARLGH